MDEPTRRAWSKPELIVLVRRGPEEAVLVACKNALVGSGLATTQGNCSLQAGKCGLCQDGPAS